MIKFLGVEYSRGATAKIINGGPALAPRAVQKMFPTADWTIITPEHVSPDSITDRFADAFNVHKQIYANTPCEKHIFIGGDHSVNFSHFSAIADQYPDEDLCLIYFDAHFDIHTPESSKAEASGSPHGTNVRHLLGEGDKRWLSLQNKKPALKPENLFCFGARSYEPAEIAYIKDQNIFYLSPEQLQSESDWEKAFQEGRKRIGNKKFIVSFDFDGIDPKSFRDVWVPEPNGLSVEFARAFIKQFIDAVNFEFVEYAANGDEQSANIVKELISFVTKTFD